MLNQGFGLFPYFLVESFGMIQDIALRFARRSTKLLGGLESEMWCTRDV